MTQPFIPPARPLIGEEEIDAVAAVMRTGATHTARAPMAAPRSTVTPTRSQSLALFRLPSALIARGA